MNSETQATISSSSSTSHKYWLSDEKHDTKSTPPSVVTKISTKTDENAQPASEASPSSLQLSTSGTSGRTPNDENKESVTLIWLDLNMGSDDDTQRTMAMLREINDFVVLHTHLDSYIDHVANARNERIFLVTSGKCVIGLLPDVETQSQVDCIFIFCLNPNKYKHLQNEYSKIIGIFSKHEELAKSIKTNIDLVEKQIQSFSFYNQQKSTRDLSRESASFLWFQLFKDLIIQMPPDNHGKRQMIQKCQEYYCGNKKEVATIQEFSDTYRRTDAIRWYTRQSFVYKLINKALRTEDIEQLYIFRFFIADLCSSLAQEYKKMREREKGVLRVYRGVKLSNEEVEKLKENEGKLISMNGFLSTSRLPSVALNFASQLTKRRDAVGVLFEIEYDLSELNDDTIVCADVAKFSDYPEEQEVLFDLDATFKIQSVNREKPDLSRANLRVTSKGADIAREYIKLNRKELEERSVAIMFGSLLCDMGQYDKSMKYFENLFQNPQGENISDIEFNLGRAHDFRGEYDKALQLYEHSYATMMMSKPVSETVSARVLNNIGLVYNSKGEYDRALDYYSRCLKMREKCLPSDHPDIGGSLNNIGLVYYRKGEYDRALDYYSKCLKMREKCLPSDHPDIAHSLGNIGSVYDNKGEYDRALDYYSKCLKIQEKCLPSDHPDIATSLNNIGLVYKSKGEYDRALDYYSKRLKIQEKCLPSDHPHIARSLNNIGSVYKSKGEYDRALDYYSKL
ncbi:unnamed protein product [Didymodactylos carnosus]|uniref:Kinesin light chain n=1 Tax=Didymodactylos carnosus TaxID=1234261 RepID=A0A814BTR9_9BILA|nr:unnamed protein product [Didymodactylos carnosus]CAF3708983.1 unnamed protein product [Didymodactylos carnosus]